MLAIIKQNVFVTRKSRSGRVAIGWQAVAAAYQPMTNRPPRDFLNNAVKNALYPLWNDRGRGNVRNFMIYEKMWPIRSLLLFFIQHNAYINVEWGTSNERQINSHWKENKILNPEAHDAVILHIRQTSFIGCTCTFKLIYDYVQCHYLIENTTTMQPRNIFKGQRRCCVKIKKI